MKAKLQGLGYQPRNQRVFINKTQFFEPVASEVWECRVGGYPACEKWLKDRKGRLLNLEEIRAYCRIVTALKLTLGIQEEIDGLYPTAEAKTIRL